MSGETRRLGGRLRAEWLLLLGAAALLAAGGLRFVAGAVDEEASWYWLAVTGAILASEVGLVRYHLQATSDAREAALDWLGLPNAATLLRGWLYAAGGGFLLVPPATPAIRWAPGLCYGVGAALDYLDGRLARRNGQSTDLGARLDLDVDVLGFLVVPLVGVAWGRLPIWYLSLSAAPIVFRAARAWRRRTNRPVHPLPARRLPRWLAGFQMAFLTVAMLPVFPVAAVHVAATVALVPSLAGFLRDWLVVTGRLPRRQE